MFNHFKTLPPEKQRKLLEQDEKGDLLLMARHLSGLQRGEFNAKMKELMTELPENDVEFGGQTITKAELMDMIHMEEAKRRAIAKEIDDFNNSFEHKTFSEIQAFEEKLKYVRAGALISETRGGFRRLFRFMDRFTHNGNAAYNISKSVAEYAKLKQIRQEKKEALRDRLRAKVSRDEMDEYTRSSPKPLDRTGKDDFSR